MDAEKSILEQISDKEEELKRKNELVCMQAEHVLSTARKEAASILGTAEMEGKREADLMFEQQMQELARDISDMREQGSKEAAKVRETGETNLPRAVSRIVTVISG